MSWVKLDDRFFDNQKVVNLSDPAQLAYIKALTYCARELTDGVLPLRKAKEFAAPKVIKELVPGLWELTADGNFRVHDYLIYNPTREKVLAERESAKQRMFGRRSPDVRANNRENIERSSPTPVPVSRIPGSSKELLSPNGEGVDKPRRTRQRALTESDIAELRDEFPGVNVDREAVKYRDWLLAKGNPHKDQLAGFRNWLRSEEDYAKTRRLPVGSNSYREDDGSIERFKARLASPG